MYFRQLNELSITVSTAKEISDDDWAAYLEGTLAIAKGFGLAANVSLLCCIHAFPNARQRQTAADFMKKHYIREMDRVAVITDSVLIRGAMTAFGWIMPKIDVRAFDMGSCRDALTWLHQVGKFDVEAALSGWHEAKMKFSIRTSSMFPASMRPPR